MKNLVSGDETVKMLGYKWSKISTSDTYIVCTCRVYASSVDMCILVTLWSTVAVCVLLSDHTRAGDNLPGWGWEVQWKVQDGGSCLCRSRSWQRWGQVFTMTTEIKLITESSDKSIIFLFLEFSQYMLLGYVSSMVLHNLHRPFKPGWHSLCSLVPRPSHRPVYDHLLYAKMEGEGLVHFITWMMSLST